MQRASSVSVASLASLVSLVGLAAAVGLGACGPKAGGSTGGAGDLREPGENAVAAPGAVPLADDIAELSRAAREGEQQSSWPRRVTFLGWDNQRHVAYRVLQCDRDELGGRGPYCELRICRAGEELARRSDLCESAASFELYGEIDFDAAAATASADELLSTLGPLWPGTPRPLDAVTLTVERMSLRVQIFDTPPRTVEEAGPDPDLGVVAAPATYVGDSPDGRCRAVLGMGTYRSEYEAVRGNLPYAFAAVGCK